ncbi:MAG: ATP-binding cassette domain-containing protein [Ignavibacteriales bacterium]
MALVSIRNVRVGFGGPLLIDGVNLHIERGERVCLLGRNGTGKSTLLKLINGDIAPDEGEITRQQGAGIAYLPQEVPQGLSGKVFNIVSNGLGSRGELLTTYHQLGSRLAKGDYTLLGELDRISQALDTDGGWQIHRQVESVISRMQLDPDAEFENLSAGLKRRVLLARGSVREPDILLLDEPTNHLDIEAINWLEEFLLDFDGTILFVTHDRVFLRKLATRIIELDRGKLTDWSCDYDTFLKRKQAALEEEVKQWTLFDKKLAQEEAWVRKGIKARRTRNEGRVRALKEMREARCRCRELIGTVRMQAQEAERSGRLVIEAEDVDFRYGDRLIIRNFSTAIMRGDKVGVIGSNGSGKTTLLNILLGKLSPQKGKVRHGTNLEVVYFDQLREQLDEEKSVLDNVGQGSHTVTMNGKPKHIIGYLRDFLFLPERARTPVSALSGGERNRLLLARLFTKPSNVLVMDEPTNDLDAETLELLEELLLDYTGTLLLVSHDRAFLNNVVTNALVFEGEGQINEYVGGYDDWLRQRKVVASSVRREKAPLKSEKPQSPPERTRKLSYKEQHELENLPERIEVLEAEQQRLYEAMSEPTFYQKGGSNIVEAKARLESLERELAEAYKRWEILEELNSSTSQET